jgi:hypothetical protein
MSKISILTYNYSNNLGAMLQAYGLSKAIEDLGMRLKSLIGPHPYKQAKCVERKSGHDIRAVSKNPMIS